MGLNMPRVLTPKLHESALPALLLKEGLITPEELAEAVEQGQRDGAFLGQTLAALGHLEESELVSLLSRHCKIPHVSLPSYDISPHVFELVPREICRKHHLLPISRLDAVLTVAMVDPLDEAALEALSAACPRLRVKPILCGWEQFRDVSARVLAQEEEAPPAPVDDHPHEPIATSASGQAIGEPDPGEEDDAMADELPFARVSDLWADPRAGAADEADIMAGLVKDAIRQAFEHIGEALDGALKERFSGGTPPQTNGLLNAVRSAADESIEEALGLLARRLSEAEPTFHQRNDGLTRVELLEVLHETVGPAVRRAAEDLLLALAEEFTHSGLAS